MNVFDTDTQKNIQSQLNAYTANGQKILNNIYTPMLKELKTDIASRFGNFDNSVFMNNLNSIESNRADALSNLAQDITAKRDELVNNELSQTGSQNNSSSGNSYNANAYAANKSSSSSLGNYANLASGVLSAMGPYGMAASAALQIGKQYM